MYSNSKKGFSILDLLVKIIFAGLFIFLLIWLFNKKIPNINMKPFYSNVFRENIKYMQDAGEAYFTDDKMPTEIGESIKISLAEMEEKNLVLPFVDEDGNTCNKYDSYVSITKLEEGYELRTNLVCSKESNFVSKALGCHTYCKTGNCPSKCKLASVTKYQFRKLVTGTKTNYSCGKGYTLSGKYCTKKTLVDSKDATKTTTTQEKVTVPAKVVQGSAKLQQLTVTTSTKDVQLTTSTTNKDVELTVSKTTKEVEVKVNTTTKDVQLTTQTTTTPATTKKVKQPYDCTRYRTEQSCSTTYQQSSYSCNCNTTVSHGKSTTTCSTCYTSVPVQSCHDVQKAYTDTCYKEVTVTDQAASTSYSCPSGTTKQTGSGSSLKCYKTETTYSCPTGTTRQTGSGSSLKCYKNDTVYSCPSGTTKQTGSGSSLKCYKTETVYSCPSGTTKQSGSGSSLKCYKTETTYSCPSNADVKEGSGSSLKCYKTVAGEVSYKCDSGYTLDSSKKECYKYETKISSSKSCPTGYKLEGNKCNKYNVTKVKATAKKSSTKYYIYKWSKNETLAGYTRTGKTKTTTGTEVVCE